MTVCCSTEVLTCWWAQLLVRITAAPSVVVHSGFIEADTDDRKQIFRIAKPSLRLTLLGFDEPQAVVVLETENLELGVETESGVFDFLLEHLFAGPDMSENPVA